MRHREIDIFKGILVLFMILAHCLQFFCDLNPDGWEWWVSEYINLTTFSGFFFAFGFSSWHAYLKKPREGVRLKILCNAFRLLIAYYISAFAYCVFIEGMKVTHTNKVRDLLSLRFLAGWSEFLVSFAILMVLIALFYPLLTRQGGRIVPVIAVISILACLLPWKHDSQLLGALIGRTESATFATLPYCLYFAAGLYTAVYGRISGRRPLAVCAAGSLLFAVSAVAGGAEPSRFPLSLPWLCGAALFLYGYYRLSVAIVSLPASKYLETLGQYSLFYLIGSNLAIFALKSSSFYRMGPAFAFGLFILLTAGLFYMQALAGTRVREVKLTQ